MSAERRGNMEGERSAEHAKLFATILEILEKAGIELTRSERTMVKLVAVQVANRAVERNEDLHIAVARALSAYRGLGNNLQRAVDSGETGYVPESFHRIAPRRLLELVEALQANELAFVQPKKESSPS